jgi:hypothetical protein
MGMNEKEKNMRFVLVVLAIAAALIMVSVDAYAADFELKGFTTATFQGSTMVRGLTEACQAEFTADTRMCNSVEVMETVNWPSLPAVSFAWVRPVFAPNLNVDTFDQSG